MQKCSFYHTHPSVYDWTPAFLWAMNVPPSLLQQFSCLQIIPISILTICILNLYFFCSARIDPGTLYMLAKHSTIGLNFQTCWFFLTDIVKLVNQVLLSTELLH